VATANPRVSNQPSRGYWICQGIGWGLYVATTVYQFRYAGLPVRRALVETLLTAALGIGLTHWFRRQARGHGWVQLPIARMAPRVIGAAMLLAVALVFAVTAVEVGLYGDRPDSVTLTIVFAIMRWTLAFLVWTALYMGYALVIQRQATELRQLQLQQALQTAELRSLKSQLNPHFLFNSLNSVRALIIDHPTQAQTAITQLARMLRYTLGAGREDLVSLERELQMVEDYLSLEALRLHSRLVVERTISESARAAQIPTMLLQTLVENAIKHGIAELPAGGTLRIGAQLADGVLSLRVDNPRPESKSSSIDDSNGIGLANAADRLRLLYDGRASVELDLSQPHQATARATIPQRA
jgi:LytS/YehU family sensor histidine kinase